MLERALGEGRKEAICGRIVEILKRSEKFYSVIIQKRSLKTFVGKRRDKYFRDLLILSY